MVKPLFSIQDAYDVTVQNNRVMFKNPKLYPEEILTSEYIPHIPFYYASNPFIPQKGMHINTLYWDTTTALMALSQGYADGAFSIVNKYFESGDPIRILPIIAVREDHRDWLKEMSVENIQDFITVVTSQESEYVLELSRKGFHGVLCKNSNNIYSLIPYCRLHKTLDKPYTFDTIEDAESFGTFITSLQQFQFAGFLYSVRIINPGLLQYISKIDKPY